MKAKHRRTLEAVFARPVSANIAWRDVEALLEALGAVIEERAGSRVAILLDGVPTVQHRPHPRPHMDKGAVAAMRDFLMACGVTPEALEHGDDA